MRVTFRELRRRNVFRAALAYLALAWLIVQIVETVFPVFGLPDEFVRWVIVLLTIGFPIVLAFAWYYEITAKGVMSTEAADAAGYSESVLNQRYIDFVIILLLVIAVVWLVYERQIGPKFPDNSVAVLAFDDLSPNGDKQWFADGLTEEILDSLARLPQLQVTARSSAFKFRDAAVSNPTIAEKLGVKYVVVGSVRLAEANLRITAQLIRATDGVHLWSDTYDRELRDVFSVQEDIAGNIARTLDVVLDDQTRETMFSLGTRNVDAFENYLHGRDFVYRWYGDSEPEQLWTANEYFDKAIEIDPDFAIAYVLRAHIYLRYLDETLPLPRRPSDMEDYMTTTWARDSLINDVTLGASLTRDPGVRYISEMARALFSSDFDSLSRLIPQFRPATIASIPDVLDIDYLLNVLLLVGRADVVLAFAEARIARSPLDEIGYNQAWGAQMASGDTSSARKFLNKGAARAGVGAITEYNLLLDHLLCGEIGEALELADDPDWGIVPMQRQVLSLVYAAAGRTPEARAIADELSRSGLNSVTLALAFQVMGDLSEAEQIMRVIDSSPTGIIQSLAIFKDAGGQYPFDPAWVPSFVGLVDGTGASLTKPVFPPGCN
jgi:TolB-like protein